MSAPRELQRRSLLKSFGVAAAASAVPSSLYAAAALATRSSSPLLNPTGSQMPDATPVPPAPGIRLNQVGYLPDQQKVASVLLQNDLLQTSPAATPTAGGNRTFQVRSVDGSAVVFSGTLSEPMLDPSSGDRLCKADFSSVTTPGSYHLEALGSVSDVIHVQPNAYADALRLTMRAFYGQRCGCKVDLGQGYKHPACHKTGDFSQSSGKTGKVGNHGGWHDAGDYGRYVVNAGFTCGTLLWAWEMFPEALRNLRLDIPESGKGTPDFLTEIKWNLDWMLTMQDPTDGGVWHKQTSLHFCGFVMPERDPLPSEIIGTGSDPYKSTCATGDLAAVMAIAARCYRPFNRRFADQCLSAARHAFSWCQAHPDVTFRNPPGVATGEYGDSHCSDEILWAAAELFRTTQEPAFEHTLTTSIGQLLPSLKIEAPSWADVAPMGLWAYAFTNPAAPAAVSIRSATQGAAALLIERYQGSGYGNTLSEGDYRWGSNSTAGNQSLLLLMAHRFQPDQAAVDAALSNLHYFLGRNCFGVSWVTHLGARPFLHPHHRPSAAAGIPAPWPGLISGGPNAHGGDPVADHLPRSAPMRMWVDDQRAYSLNEVAINWNAPLVFLLAAANTRLHT